MNDRGLVQDECGLQTGDATDLAAGTVLRPLDTVPPRHRLVAARDGRLLVFQAHIPLD